MVLYVGADLSRKRIDWEAVYSDGVVFGRGVAAVDRAGLAAFAAGLDGHAEGVVMVIESMTGARYVHDVLEQAGWEVQVADARRARERIVALAPTRGVKTDRTDAAGLADLARRGLVPEIWLPDPDKRILGCPCQDRPGTTAAARAVADHRRGHPGGDRPPRRGDLHLTATLPRRGV